MSVSVGTVQSLNGKFFAKDSSGNITELKSGDTITQGMTVFGDKNNPSSASIDIAMDADKNVISLSGEQEQLFDASTVQDVSVFDDALASDSIENILNSDLYAPDDVTTDNKDKTADDETTAGDEKPKEEDGHSAEFAARDGNVVDVNSDLRDAKFKFRSHTFELKSVFDNQDEHSLSPINSDSNNFFQPMISAIPPRPTSTPTPIAEQPTTTPSVSTPSKPALFGEVSLSGDTLVHEGDSASYTLTLTNPPLTSLSVLIKISHIDTNNFDITPKTMTVTIPSGQTTTTFNINNIYTDAVEPNEQYKVTIVGTNGGGYDNLTLGNTNVNTTITDDSPSIVINDVTKNEDDGTMTFTVTLDRVIGSDVTFDYTSAPGTATSGPDYTPVNGSGTIIAGHTTTTITVPIIDDYLTENSEQFTINLSNAINATIADEQGVGTILDSGSEVNKTSASDTVYLQLAQNDTAREGTGETLTHNFTLVDKDGNSVNLPTGESIDVTLTYAGITGLDGVENADFTTKHVTYTITGDGGSSYSITNTVADDYLTEPTEGYTVSIGSIDTTSGAFENIAIDSSNNSAEGRITDDPAVTTNAGIVLVAVDDPTAVTNVSDLPLDADGKLIIDNNNITSEGGKFYYIPVAVDADGKPLDTQGGTVDLTYTDIDTIAGTDYDNTTTQATIGTVFSVDAIVDATTGEPNENFTVSISNPQNTPYENAVVDTNNNDKVTSTIDGNVYVKITNNDEQIEGNDLTHTIVLTDVHGNPITANVPAGETITVTLEYSNDTTEDADFTAPKNTTPFDITITAGDHSTVITNSTIDDFISDNNENYTLTITNVAQSNASYAGVEIIDAQKSVTGTILDGVILGTPTDAGVDEDNFDMATNVTTITDTQSLNITAPNGDNAYNLLFDGNPTFSSDDGSFNTANGDSLTSDGTVIEYVVSGDTTTAYAGAGRANSDRVFEITLNKHNAGGGDDDYTYTQYKNIDHPLANVDDNVVLTFGYKISDQGQTSSVENFTVTVNDSMPSGAPQNITLNEDNSQTIYISDESFAGGNITLNNGDGDSLVTNGNSVDIYDNTTDKNVVGTLTNNGDGTLTFNPTANFSGATAGFTYGVSDGDGDAATATISITVNPIADKADMNGVHANLNEATIVTTTQYLEDNNNNAGVEGGADYTATVGLILPQITDNTDETAANSNDDQPERLGLITLTSSTGETITAGGSDYTVDSNGTTIFINDVANYHYNGITAADADISLTQAQFEAIVVKFENENAINPKFTVSVDEYEVNDDNTLKAIASANNTQSYEVDILAVTDPITLAWDADPSNLGSYTATDFTFDTVNEGVAVIDLKSLLTKTSGLETDAHGDLDGSEHRSYTISGIPEGSIITLDGKSVAAGSDGTATVNFPDNTVDDPSFTMTVNEQYSGTINGTITLNVTDTDSDSTGAIATESASVDFTMDINPVADQVTLKVAQARGDEDAGRTNSNDENVSASTIDAPENGIELNINVISDDNKDIGPAPVNPKETYNVTIDKVPDGGSLHIWDNAASSWKTVDETNAGTDGNLEIVNNGDGTWKVTITDYQNDHLTKFIPPYNSDNDYTFDITAYSMDNGASGIALAQTLQIGVTVDGVADIPVNDDLATTTATDDSSTDHTFTLVSAEDSGAINLKGAFATPTLLDSNDATAANGGDGSETLTFKVTGLADGFGINGATYIGGSGTDRVWLVDKAALNADTVTLSTPTNYAGEVDFKVQFVTTENSGDSKTHTEKDISLMVTPVAEATATINSSDTQDEDTSKALDFGFTTPDTDGPSAGEESLQSFSIDVTGLQAAGITLVSNGVDLTTGKTGYQNVTVTNGVLETVTATLPQDSDADYSFNISYTYQDVAVDGNGNTYTDTVTKTDQAYNVTVNAITDDISLAIATTATDAGITDNAGHVTVTDNGTFTKTLTVTGLDSDGRGSPDTDGSEIFTRVTVSGVPEGITVGGADGTYAGDTGGGNYSGYWYVDVPNDAINPDGTYNLVFDVDGTFAPGLPDYPITVTAYSEDAGNGVEQSDAQNFTLTIDNAITGPGPGIPATITQFYQDIDNDSTHDHAYLVSTTPDTTITDADAYEGSVLREDVQFKLSDVVHVETDTTGASSQAFSITLKNVPAGVTIEGMTLNANGFYTLSGTGDQTAIVSKLQSILITPESNQNTVATDISNTDLAFDIELTTYASGGASHTALINFSGSVLPVTDEMNLSVVNDGATNEDIAQIFSITLGEGADGANTQIVDGKAYLKVTEHYTDTIGGDGTAGTLSYNGNPITTTAISGVAGIADGNYYVINGVSNNQTLDFSFTPALNRDGSITVDTYVKNIESESWTTYTPDPIASHQTFSFDVNAVTDGFTLASATANGSEDGMIPLGITLTSSDSSEQISSVSISDVPDGFLLYYGTDAGSAVIAQNLGTTGATTSIEMTYGIPENVDVNRWNIPLSGGALPAYIGLKAPENWSGTIPAITVNSVDMDGNSSSDTLNITIDPVVDTLTLNTTKTFGSEGDDILLNLNANVQDLDGSETVKLELSGLGDGASFKADGTEIDAAHISYASGSDTYTITDIAASDINSLSFVQSAMSGNVSVNAYMVESDGSTSAPVAGTDFNVNISAVTPTGGDDALLYSGLAIDGGGGTDTVSLKSGITLDFTKLDNIEKVDLTANGDHDVTSLTLQDVVDMTDSNNTLEIIGDTNDSVAAVDTTGWTKSSETDNGTSVTYAYSKDGSSDSITLTVDDNVNNTGL